MKEKMKPMKQWTVQEVAIWLQCIGLADKTDHFKSLTGSDLCEMPSLTRDHLIRALGEDQANELIQKIEFADSIYRNKNEQELILALERLTSEKEQLEKESIVKDRRIADLEQTVNDRSQENHPVDHLLAIEHRHEEERRRMEERHEQEIPMEETEILHNRKLELEKQHREVIHFGGKRHFQESPTDIHRFY
jgi:hypothetical protein